MLKYVTHLCGYSSFGTAIMMKADWYSGILFLNIRTNRPSSKILCWDLVIYKYSMCTAASNWCLSFHCDNQRIRKFIEFHCSLVTIVSLVILLLYIDIGGIAVEMCIILCTIENTVCIQPYFIVFNSHVTTVFLHTILCCTNVIPWALAFKHSVSNIFISSGDKFSQGPNHLCKFIT